MMIVIPVPKHGDILYHNLTKVQPKYFNSNKNNIINNVFLEINYKINFDEWINHNNKIVKIIKKFYNIIKKKYINNKLPENLDDLDGETYDKNNKNIYLYEDKKKWWFSIKTMSKLLISNLCYFDSDYLNNYTKSPNNPYTNKQFNYNTYVSIYQQFKNYNAVPDMFLLFKLSNFDLDKFSACYSISINQYICKYAYPNLESEILADLFINITQTYNINYINYNKLYHFSDFIKTDILRILNYIHNPINTHCDIKKYIKNILKFHFYLIKKARKQPVLSDSPSNMNVESDSHSNMNVESDSPSNMNVESDSPSNMNVESDSPSNMNVESDLENNEQHSENDNDSINNDSINNDSINNDSINNDSINNDSINNDSVNNDYIISDSENENENNDSENENENNDSENENNDSEDDYSDSENENENNDSENENNDSEDDYSDSDNENNENNDSENENNNSENENENNDSENENNDSENENNDSENDNIIIDGIIYDFSSVEIDNNDLNSTSNLMEVE